MTIKFFSGGASIGAVLEQMLRLCPLIRQENRGKRKGAPILGDCVWVGVNPTVVGSITVGDDVLIAPGAFVNCDVPGHSIVLGNPCRIIPCENSNVGNINRKIPF